jgi:heat shock protein HslJ
MIRLTAACALLFGTACVGDESPAKYGASGKFWSLSEIDGAAFGARATMEFDEAGWIKGQAPCNRYSAQQKAPYPWFEVGPTMATKMACPDLAAESAFFTALSAMTLSEVGNTTLILSNDAGRTMVFKSE